MGIVSQQESIPWTIRGVGFDMTKITSFCSEEHVPFQLAIMDLHGTKEQLSTDFFSKLALALNTLNSQYEYIFVCFVDFITIAMLIEGISSQSTKVHYEEFGVIHTQKDDAWTSGTVEIATVILFISKVDKFEAIDKALTKNVFISGSSGQNKEFIDKGFIDGLITGFCPEHSYVVEIYCGGVVLEESLLLKRRCIALCKDELEAMELESKCSTLLNSDPSLQEWCGASGGTKGQSLDDAEKENLQNFYIDDPPSTEDEAESDNNESKNDIDDDKEVGDAVDSEDEGQRNEEDQGHYIGNQGNEDIGVHGKDDEGGDGVAMEVSNDGVARAIEKIGDTDVNKDYHAHSPSSSQSKKDMHKEGEDRDNTAQLEQHYEIPTREISSHDLNARGNKDNIVEVDHINDSSWQTSSRPSRDRTKETEGNLDLQVHVEVSENTDKITEEIQETVATKEIQVEIVERIDEGTCSTDKGKIVESKDFAAEGENKDKVSEEIQETVATKEIQEEIVERIDEATCATDKGKIVESKDFVAEGVEKTKGAAASNNHKSSVQEVEQRVEELRSDTQKSRPLGSLYSFERDGDKLVFQSSPINREIQLSLGDIIIDEYGSMKRK